MKREQKGERTKRRMAEALLSLLSERPIGSISIRMITDACGLDRQTFYYHFADIYALLKFAFSSSLLPTLQEAQRGKNMQVSFRQVMLFLQENKRAVTTLLESGGRPLLREALYADAQGVFAATVIPRLKKEGVSARRAEEAAQTCRRMVVSVIIDWAEGYDCRAPEDLVRATMDDVEDYLRGVSLRSGAR